jgi:hypothetical protein
VTKGYLLLAAVCDGTLAMTAQFTLIRVVCNNTLAIALVGKTDVVKVLHSTAFDPKAVKHQSGVRPNRPVGMLHRICVCSVKKERKPEIAVSGRYMKVMTIEDVSHLSLAVFMDSFSLYESAFVQVVMDETAILKLRLRLVWNCDYSRSCFDN